jgi:Uncharacterized protein related to plant photosystem II stability/assembly factor
MKYFMAFAVAIALIFCYVCDLKAQWVKTNGPRGSSGYIYSIAVDSVNIFAAAGSGVYLSTDKGISWSLVYTDLTNNYSNSVGSLLISDPYVYAGKNGTGVFRSTDHGVSWTSVNTSILSDYTNSGYPTIVALAESDSAILASAYYGGGGVFRSTDNGASWTIPDAGLKNFTCFAVHGSNVFAGSTGYLSLNYGLYFSANNGATWTVTNLGEKDVYSVAVKGTTVFAGTDSSIFRSTDNGVTWNSTDLGVSRTYVNAIVINPSGSFVFAGTDSGAFRSTDFGKTWTAINTGLTSKNIFSLALYPAGSADSSYIFAGTGCGIFRSTDNGSTWTICGLPNTNFLAFTGSILLAGSGYTKNLSSNRYNYNGMGTIRGSDIFHSTDNGSIWTEVDSGLAGTNTRLTSLAVNGSNIFAGTNPGGVFLSTNGGVSWDSANSGMNNTNVLALVSNESGIFAGTDSGGVNRSSNDGLSWDPFNNGLTDTHINAFAVSGSNIFAGSGFFGLVGIYPRRLMVPMNDIFLSSDNGTTWARIDSELYVKSLITCLSANGSNLMVAKGSTTPNGYQYILNGGVYRITFDGIKWNMVDSALIGYHVTSLTSTGSNFFAGTTTSGVFVSSNNGASWVSINSGLADSNVASLVIGNSNLFAATSSGVWRRPLSEITSVQPPNGMFPKNYSLAQNYPNPFNPSTVINYQLPDAGTQFFVSLKVYDILGREVVTLVNGMKEAGYYTATFDGSKFASGIYFTRFIVQPQEGKSQGDRLFVQVRKMLLMK